METDNIFAKFFDDPCCKLKCFEKVVKYDYERLRDSFFDKNEEEQNQFIMDFFHSQEYLHDMIYFVNKNHVCQKMWLFCNGIGKTR